MALRSTTVGLHVAKQALRARAAFVEFRGAEAAIARQAQINQLPRVEWKGKPLFTLRCNGTSGKGPHNCNVPEGLLWSLISLNRFLCPYHVNDALWESDEPARTAVLTLSEEGKVDG